MLLLGVQYKNHMEGSKLGFSLQPWGSPWGNPCLLLSTFVKGMGDVSGDRVDLCDQNIQETVVLYIQVWSQSLRAQAGWLISWLCDVQQTTHPL